jgi:hypothetical protein
LLSRQKLTGRLRVDTSGLPSRLFVHLQQSKICLYVRSRQEHTCAGSWIEAGSGQQTQSLGLGLIALPQGAFLQKCLLTFTWEENGKIKEEVLRIEKGLILDTRRSGLTQKPEEIRQSYVQPRVPASRNWRYKVKLFDGYTWQNLKTESWMVFDVIRGTTVTLMHSTKTSDILTGVNRWWDHPVLSIKACPLLNGDGDDRQAGCMTGSSAVPGEPLRIVLPEGASLHDYRFSFTWAERDRIQEGGTIVDRSLQPVPLP